MMIAERDFVKKIKQENTLIKLEICPQQFILMTLENNIPFIRWCSDSRLQPKSKLVAINGVTLQTMTIDEIQSVVQSVKPIWLEIELPPPTVK